MRGRLLLAAVFVAALWGLYVLSLQFVAYTSDAFVATDVLQVAPEVGGTIAAVHVIDNQFVRQGDPLIDIDPTPYLLQVELRRAEVAKAEADEQSAIRDVAHAEAERATKLASQGLARRTERRFADLVGQGAASQLVFDEAKTKMSEAETAVRASEASLEAARQAVEARKAAVGVAKRALDLASWDLSQTRLLAPVSGHVNNLWLRVGDYARPGVPRLGIVASDRWYVIALYKEEAIRHLSEGGSVWIHLTFIPGSCSAAASRECRAASAASCSRRRSFPRSRQPPAGSAFSGVSRCASFRPGAGRCPFARRRQRPDAGRLRMVAPSAGELWSVARHWRQFADGIRADIVGFDSSRPARPPRRRLRSGVALAVWCAVVLDLDFPMWSGMSAFICLQASVAATALKGMLRIVGTVAGALLAAFLVGCHRRRPSGIARGVVRLRLVRPLSILPQPLYVRLAAGLHYHRPGADDGIADPTAGLHFAAYRAAEIVVGVAAAWVAGVLLLPEATVPHTDQALLELPKLQSKRHAAFTALEGGIGIAAVMVLYAALDLPGFSSANVSVARIADPDPRVGRHRGFLRLIGCIVGGGAGLLMVGFAIDWLPALLFWLFAWCTVFGYFGSGSPGSAYFGMQAAFAFCIAFVGADPATTLEPVIDRLAGILVGLAVFWVIDIIVGAAEGGGECDGGQLLCPVVSGLA